jgi:hypothetical protein
MAQFTFNIANSDIQRVLNAWVQDYSSTLPNGSPNPLTHAQAFKQRLMDYIQRGVLQYEAQQTLNAAIAAANVFSTTIDIT